MSNEQTLEGDFLTSAVARINQGRVSWGKVVQLITETALERYESGNLNANDRGAVKAAAISLIEQRLGVLEEAEIDGEKKRVDSWLPESIDSSLFPQMSAGLVDSIFDHLFGKE